MLQRAGTNTRAEISVGFRARQSSAEARDVVHSENREATLIVRRTMSAARTECGHSRFVLVSRRPRKSWATSSWIVR